MTRHTHTLIAATSALALGQAAHAPPAGRVAIVAAAIAANAIPDRDRHAQRGQKRGMTHWLLTGLALTVVPWQLAAILAPSLAGPVSLSFLAAYTLHLLADACTPEGTPLFGPIWTRPIRLLPFRIRIVSTRPPAGWTACPYTPIPEPLVFTLIALADLIWLLPWLTA